MAITQVNVSVSCDLYYTEWYHIGHGNTMILVTEVSLSIDREHTEQEIDAIIQTSVLCVDKTCFPRPGHICIS